MAGPFSSIINAVKTLPQKYPLSIIYFLVPVLVDLSQSTAVHIIDEAVDSDVVGDEG